MLIIFSVDTFFVSFLSAELSSIFPGNPTTSPFSNPTHKQKIKHYQHENVVIHSGRLQWSFGLRIVHKNLDHDENSGEHVEERDEGLEGGEIERRGIRKVVGKTVDWVVHYLES